MKLILENPYRIAGILANASVKELVKQKNKISKFAEIGRQVDSELDFPFMDTVDRTNLNTVNTAFAEIEQNQGKVRYSLFWFLNSSPFDNTAIEYLKNGYKEKAVEIWEKVTNGKDITSKNYSCFNNLGTLKLLSDFKEEIKEGIEAKIKLIESPVFEDFVLTVADQTYTIDNQKQAEKFVDDILKQFKRKYSIADTIKLFINSNGSIQKYLTQKFTEEPIHNIESQIASCKKKRKADKANAYGFGVRLYTNTKDDLSFIKSILGTGGLKYKAVADRLANEIMQCGIDYLNECQENNSSEEYFEPAQKLIKLAGSIAVGRLVKDRAKDSLSALEEMENRVVLKAIDLIQSIKNEYETIEASYRRQIEERNKTNVLVILGLETINYSVVDVIVKNSIYWDKVNESLKEILPYDNLRKIKASSNTELKTKFEELAYWLKEHSQSNYLISNIIEKYNRMPAKLPFKIISSEITNTENKPLYTKFIRYIGLKLNVEVEESCTVNFYLKYIDPDGNLNRNSKISPKGYTLSDLKSLEPKTKSITLSGWGNAEKCNYDIGEHRIEVYVDADEYLIYTKKFTVEIAPSEKLEKEIANEEKKLNKIIQTNYYETEIISAINEMTEIQKFKLFRGSSEKHSQIQAQQAKIDRLIQQSKEKKKKDIQIQKEKIYKLKMKLSLQTY